MKNVLISFIGDTEYDAVTYDSFPNGKEYKSKLFVRCYLNYRKDVGDKIDKLIVIGTDTSAWGALLDGCEGQEQLVNELKDIKAIRGNGNNFIESDLEDYDQRLAICLEKLQVVLGKKFEIPEIELTPHFSDIDPTSITQLYDLYHRIGQELKDTCNVSMDITYGLRWMPVVCHQAMSEYGTVLSNLVYGEKERAKPIGHYRDLSQSCKISRVNKALNSIDSKLNFHTLANEIKNDWSTMSEVLENLNNTVAFSAMSVCTQDCEDFVRECEIMQNTDDYSNIVAFDSIKNTLLAIKKQIIKGIAHTTGKMTDLTYIFNLVELMLDKYLLLQAAIATEQALQLIVMGEIYDENSQIKYEDFNNEYYQCRNMIASRNASTRKLFNDIRVSRNTFAHNFASSDNLIANEKKEELSKNLKKLKKFATKFYNRV